MCHTKTNEHSVQHGVERRMQMSAVEAAELLAIAHMQEARTLWSSRRIRSFVLSQRPSPERHPGAAEGSGPRPQGPSSIAKTWRFGAQRG